jgi:uncharacterized membrane protein YeaQ/YmgE (transglycosylase-associated protein family)
MPSDLDNQVHKIYEVVDFRLVGPYSLEVEFNDGTTQKIDFDGVLEGQMYGPLKDATMFQKVRLDRARGNLVWPNDADFDPEILHDWPERKAGMVAAAARWELTSDHPPLWLHMLWSVLLGFVAGAIASFRMHTHLGFFLTTLLGIAGSIIGGWIARMFSNRSETIARHEGLYATGASVLGVVLVLTVVSVFGWGS